MLTKEEIKNKVEELMKNYALTTPFSVSSLASMLGIDIEEVDQESMNKIVKEDEKNDIEDKGSILGFFNRIEKKIYINGTDQPLTRQRFTIAHEIAHFVLHDGSEEEKNFRQSVRRDDLITFIPASSGKDIRFVSDTASKEIEANQFAAYLLVPDNELKERLPLVEIWGGGENFIRGLSNLFGISLETMRIRLKTFKEENYSIWERYNLNVMLF